MVVSSYDFALTANGASASDSPAQTNASLAPAKAVDGDNSTYWESKNKPANNNPQSLIIGFPYTLKIHKVRFLASASNPRPKDYTWEVSSDNVNYTAVKTVDNNDCTDRTDTFAAASNVNYLKLSVTKTGGGNTGVRIAVLETPGGKITSRGTVASFSRQIQRTASVIDGTTVPTCSSVTTPAQAAHEPDWTEIVPPA
jgi:hypothetical protein